MIVAVLDTNVLVSAACLPKSLPAHLLRLWLNQGFEMALSADILREFNDVMRRPKIRDKYNITEEHIATFTTAFADVALLLSPSDIPNAVPLDAADNHIIGCAVTSRANYVVSGDRHLLELRRYGDIHIVTTSEFLAVLQAAGIG
jgi:putative PIN family toxin of toxin-antitoxin system